MLKGTTEDPEICYTRAFNSKQNFSNFDLAVLSYLYTVYDIDNLTIGFGIYSDYVYQYRIPERRQSK